MLSEREFSICKFYVDGTYAYVSRFVDAREAVYTAALHTDQNDKTLDRVIITDGGDNTVFEWKRGEGVTFPPPQEMELYRVKTLQS